MTPDKILLIMDQARTQYAPLSTTPFHYGPAQTRSFRTVNVKPPFIWVNTDGLLKFREVRGVRFYAIEFRIVTIAANMETPHDANRLLVDAITYATFYVNEHLLPSLVGDVSEVLYEPFYAQDAEIFSGMAVRIAVSVPVACQVAPIVLPAGGSLLTDPAQ